MRLLGNLIWLLFGGFFVALQYFLASLSLAITIVGIPFAWQTLKLARLALWPFGYETVQGERASGCLYIIANIWWLLFGGISIALTHILFGLLLFLTIIGIPWGMQHFKLAGMALTPFGRDIRPVN